jgi:hypothetical protein
VEIPTQTHQTYRICIEKLACFRKRFHQVKHGNRHAIQQLARAGARAIKMKSVHEILTDHLKTDWGSNVLFGSTNTKRSCIFVY